MKLRNIPLYLAILVIFVVTGVYLYSDEEKSEKPIILWEDLTANYQAHYCRSFATAQTENLMKRSSWRLMNYQQELRIHCKSVFEEVFDNVLSTKRNIATFSDGMIELKEYNLESTYLPIWRLTKITNIQSSKDLDKEVFYFNLKFDNQCQFYVQFASNEEANNAQKSMVESYNRFFEKHQVSISHDNKINENIIHMNYKNCT